MTNLPDDFEPDNSDIMTPQEEYELIQILAEVEKEEGLDGFVDTPRPGGDSSE